MKAELLREDTSMMISHIWFKLEEHGAYTHIFNQMSASHIVNGPMPEKWQKEFVNQFNRHQDKYIATWDKMTSGKTCLRAYAKGPFS